MESGTLRTALGQDRPEEGGGITCKQSERRRKRIPVEVSGHVHRSIYRELSTKAARPATRSIMAEGYKTGGTWCCIEISKRR